MEVTLVKNLGSIIGFAIAGIFVMSVWGAFAEAYGIFGGWFAGLMIISIMWFMNHFLGLVANEGAIVDMAAGIGICGTMRDVFLQGPQAGINSLPTLAFVIIGAIIGGMAAVAVEKVWAERDAAKTKDISM
jgi:hypothetical protein